jgi:hypothetical protein
MSGDLILEVNGKDLRTAAYEHVAYTLKVEFCFSYKEIFKLFLIRHFHIVVFILKLDV